MKRLIYPIMASLLTIFVFSQCRTQADVAQNGRLSVIEYDNPVVTGEFSEVAELVLNLSQPQFIRELSFDLTTSDTLESLRIFQLMDHEGERKKFPIAAIKDVVGSNVLYIDRQLPAGEHRFFVSVFPKTREEGLNNVRINFNHMASEKSRYMVTRDPL